ncbi:hypothetical protein AXF42_Ash007280 [Apostasia shenzhenica]|uniref:Uncharacterized protein n=1 Tax=Apostasia shenzhenica TaxID=1088818 RepID=A0A2I0B9R0_9ASPA|nr:hypothetical protein AXF42_Ash007280 [Apostasia shenzhenica]
MQYVPLIVVKHIDARARLPRGTEELTNIYGASDGSPVVPRRAGVVMAMFSSIAGSLREEIPESGGPAKLDQAGVKRSSVRKEAPKKPKIRLSSAGEGAHAASRSYQGDARPAPLVENAIMVADDEV